MPSTRACGFLLRLGDLRPVRMNCLPLVAESAVDLCAVPARSDSSLGVVLIQVVGEYSCVSVQL